MEHNKHLEEAIRVEVGVPIPMLQTFSKPYVIGYKDGVPIKRYPKGYAHGYTKVDWASNFKEFKDFKISLSLEEKELCRAFQNSMKKQQRKS